MDTRGAPRPSPYSVQMLDASSSNPIRAPPQRTSPEPGGYSQTILGGASKTGTNFTSGNPQQFASAKPTGSAYDLQMTKKIVDPYVSLNMSEREPPPYDEHEKHPVEARSRSNHEEIELHEGGGLLTDQPQAIQTMVKMVTMLNFMKVINFTFLAGLCLCLCVNLHYRNRRRHL